jgi:hypothetical protein
MKVFKRRRGFQEVEQTVTDRGWGWDSSKHDAGESDYIRIDFKVGETEGIALWSSFNGKFIGQLKDKTALNPSFSSDNTKHENTEWFKALLETFYA